MVVQTMYSETFVLKEKIMNKIKILLIIYVSIGIGLYFGANKKVKILEKNKKIFFIAL